MELSNDLVSQFVKMTNGNTKVQNEVTVYGTVVNSNDQNFVKLDGSELLTPVSTTINITDGERVTVMIKDHVAVVTGNISAPAARDTDVKNVANQISEFEIVVADTVYAQNGKIDNLTADNVIIKDKLTATDAEIETLVSDNVIIKDKLTAKDAEIADLTATKLNAETANLTFATIDNLNATNVEVNTVKGNFADFSQLTADNLTAIDANIQNLESNKLSTQEATITYANIDFSNIGMAAVEKLFTDAGIINNLVVGEASITGELVGVTIKGDLIEGNTIVADKLVVKGSDGVYYKLNISANTIESEQTEYNSLSGSIITAKSITASKVNVQDLVAFDATIGGFKITKDSIYSGVKASVDNTTKGIYLDNIGQMAIGDSKNFLKFFKDADGTWKLVISASSIKMSASNDYIEDVIDRTVKSIETMYAINENPTAAPIDGWSLTPPTWSDGRYIWSKQKTTLMDGTSTENDPVCITGAKGYDAIVLNTISSNGHMFKNTSVSTTLSVEIMFGGIQITSSSDMYLYFGGNARIIWQQKKRGETLYTDIDQNDPRLSDNGFIFTLTTNDLKLETVYNCLLDC